MSDIAELYMSGIVLSSLISPLLSTENGKGRVRALYGRYELREGDTDTAECTERVEAVVTAVLPLDEAPPNDFSFMGLASTRKCSPHKLSFNETKLLTGGMHEIALTKGRSNDAFPLLLLLVTTAPDSISSISTKKVEYSAFQSKRDLPTSYSSLTARKAIPLRIDNLVDSLSGFIRLSSFWRHSPTIEGTQSCGEIKRPSAESFQSLLTEVEKASKRKQELLQRVFELERLSNRV
ncbi:hypothetical protein TRVL_06352 [Trypanosoma vivax]|uniref:Uncharacterized protein n=1 Tax=Trypanosoma vivax (strain Y486) TaxID=1055687 RepID=G0TRB6_TRYVY|nr:hypothetical protein TRVL_06352 [Trypanosoma vivax]CCC46480.1 conserved hypothetical protein [Trypanosoma vivax Y486]